MAVRIVNIDNKLRDSIEEALDYNDKTGKKRPYYLGISISKAKAILLPIRGKCPLSYSLPLNSSNNKKTNPGIDFSKMIIIDKKDLSFLTVSTSADSKMVADINKKKKIILKKTIDTINDYKIMVNKVKNGKDLNKEEIFLKNRSTLRNYIK